MAGQIKPEKLVELKVMYFSESRGWFLNVFDSKATFSKSSLTFKKTKNIPIGCPDLLGCDSQGNFLAIELKAPGRENVCSKEQFLFLKKYIDRGAFAIVVSDVESLSSAYDKWSTLKKESNFDSKTYLHSLLPKKIMLKIGKNKKIIPAPSF